MEKITRIRIMRFWYAPAVYHSNSSKIVCKYSSFQDCIQKHYILLVLLFLKLKTVPWFLSSPTFSRLSPLPNILLSMWALFNRSMWQMFRHTSISLPSDCCMFFFFFWELFKSNFRCTINTPCVDRKSLSFKFSLDYIQEKSNKPTMKQDEVYRMYTK